MFQFDLTSPRNSGLPSNDFDFCFHRHLYNHRRHHVLQQQQHQVTKYVDKCSDSIDVGVTLPSSSSTTRTSQYRIMAAENVATASVYRWFSYEFQSNNDADADGDGAASRSRKKQHKRKRREDVDCACQRQIYVSSTASVEEKTRLQKREISHCRFTWYSRKIIKHEKLLLLPVFSSSSSSTPSSLTTSVFSAPNDDCVPSILDLASGVDSSDDGENWLLKIKRIKDAIDREKRKRAFSKCSRWYNLKDANGNTALLVSGQKLLREGCYDKAVELATILLAEGSDVNASNNENRTLISYSIRYMDRSIRLTTLLLNYGANVWPAAAAPTNRINRPVEFTLPSHKNYVSNDCRLAIEIEKYMPEGALRIGLCDKNNVGDGVVDGNDNDDNCNGNRSSAFACFLTSVVNRLELNDDCLRTLYLLAEVMGEHPDLMRSHVMNTMFRHAKCYSILGPVFLQIKLAMSPYWTQPQTLKYLCKSIIRKSIFSVAGRYITVENTRSLMLPSSLEYYVMLEN